MNNVSKIPKSSRSFIGTLNEEENLLRSCWEEKSLVLSFGAKFIMENYAAKLFNTLRMEGFLEPRIYTHSLLFPFLLKLIMVYRMYFIPINWEAVFQEKHF